MVNRGLVDGGGCQYSRHDGSSGWMRDSCMIQSACKW